jgi:hypothetical protein
MDEAVIGNIIGNLLTALAKIVDSMGGVIVIPAHEFDNFARRSLGWELQFFAQPREPGENPEQYVIRLEKNPCDGSENA